MPILNYNVLGALVERLFCRNGNHGAFESVLALYKIFILIIELLSRKSKSQYMESRFSAVF